MRRVASFLAIVALLRACTLFQKRVTYNLTFNVDNATIKEELIWSSLRLIERHADNLKTTVKDKEVRTESGATSISVTLARADAADALTMLLTKPFTMRFMVEAPAGQGDVTVGSQGSFKDGGVGERDLFWAEAAKDTETEKGAVRLLFTPEGRARLKDFLHTHRSKTIGLFVQDRLVSKLIAKELQDEIIIRGIPSSELAFDFADEVNVGLHIMFSPAS